MTIEKRFAVAKDYYKTEYPLRHIAKQYGIAPGTVKNISNYIHEGNFEQPDYVVIKVERKWVEGIRQLLLTRGIDYEIPEKFELTEYYESKL